MKYIIKNIFRIYRMLFQIVSDLHIEFKNDSIPNPLDYITPSADTIILAGDIGTFYKYEQLEGFLKRLSGYFKRIVYVMGNHEFYKQYNKDPLDMVDILKYSERLEEAIPKLYILNRKSIVINNKYCIAGCTLWSNPCNLRYLPKFVRLHGVTLEQYKNLHKEDVQYLKHIINVCKKEDLKLIIVTHYLPSYKLIPEHSRYSRFAGLYATDLEYLIEQESDAIDAWVCGHIHNNFNMNLYGVDIVSNQRGKPRDHIRDFCKKFTINIL